MKQGLTYQLTERKGAADGHSAAVPLSGAFNYIDILEFIDQNSSWCTLLKSKSDSVYPLLISPFPPNAIRFKTA